MSGGGGAVAAPLSEFRDAHKGAGMVLPAITQSVSPAPAVSVGTAAAPANANPGNFRRESGHGKYGAWQNNGTNGQRHIRGWFSAA